MRLPGREARRSHGDHGCRGRVGVSGRQLQRLLGAWNFAAAFRREALACLGVCFQASAKLPPSKPCRLTGAALDVLLAIACIAPLLEGNLRAAPCDRLYCTDASLLNGGTCPAPVGREQWMQLYSLIEERGSTPASTGDFRFPRRSFVASASRSPLASSHSLGA